METGDNLDETNFQLVADAATCNTSWVVSGGAITDGGGITFDMSACVAWINGYYVSVDAITAQALTDASTNYIWLEPDGTVTDETAGTNPGNAILLGIVTTSGGDVTAVTHRAETSHAAAAQITQGLNVFRYKDADEAVQSDTTLSADSDLTFTANAREIWDLEYVIIVDQDSAAADFQCRVSIPSGGVTSFAMGPDSDVYSSATTGSGEAGTATYAHTTGVDGSTHQIQQSTFTNEGVVHVRAVAFIGSAGGAVDFEWSQINSTASDTTVKAGSFLIGRRVLG